MGKQLSPAAARAELARRKQKAKKPWDPIAILQDYQQPWYTDPEDDRVVEGTRQVGKSIFAAVELIEAGRKHPGSESAYVDMDINHAEKVVWRDVIRLLDEYDVPAEIADDELRFTNGAVGYIFSGRPAEVAKLQGLKFAILIIDECQEAHALDDILAMVRPALMRWGGRVLLLGVPGRLREMGPWWNATHGESAHLYGQHRAHYRQNKYLNPEAQERQREKARKQLGETAPDFIRFWDGLWPDADNSLQVYRYSPTRNSYVGEPPVCLHYASGTDPAGLRDREATVVLGWGNPEDPTDNRIWVVAEEVSTKGGGGDYTDTAEVLLRLSQRYNLKRQFYDFGSAGKSILLATAQRDFHCWLEAVPTKDLDFEIPRINSLLAQGRLMVPKGSALENDLCFCVWDKTRLAAGKNSYSSRGVHPDVADALRAAAWAVDGIAPPPAKAVKPKPQLDPFDAELVRLQQATKYHRPGRKPYDHRR